MPELTLREHVSLAPLTTIRLGGEARWFAECTSVDALREAIAFSQRERCRIFVLGGGSNVIIADSGFNGLVVRIALRGIRKDEEGETVSLTAAAGEPWDNVVAAAVNEGLAGIECLSGIPGLAGATPIQNVGAYGQEIHETVVAVNALDRQTFEEVEFDNEECLFGYRESRFKGKDRGRYIVTAVTYRLRRNQPPVIRYAELAKHLETEKAPSEGPEALRAVRSAVLALRKSKSMVADPADPNSRSVGSFFMNPVLSERAFSELTSRVREANPPINIPSYRSDAGVKVPAAWLIEQAGFHKGYRKGGVGISDHHALALVNRGGTAAEVLALAGEIQSAVGKKVGIVLKREAVIVGDG